VGRTTAIEHAGRIRVLVGAALLALAALVAVLLIRGGSDRYEITAEFDNASQLVPGNEVLAAGIPVGSVESIELSNGSTALVTLSIDEATAPLPEGVRATVRTGSLGTVAGRSVELDYPSDADQAAPIEDGGSLSLAETTSEVDVDQILNTLGPETADDLRRVLVGLGRALDGVEQQANEGGRLFNPLLSTSRIAVNELNRSRADLEQLIADGSLLSGTLAQRASEFPELLANLDATLNAIGREQTELTAAVEKLPTFLRETNTTLVNLRFAADDLDPLLAASLPVAERAGPFFAEFRRASAAAVPTVRDLNAIVSRPGDANDLTELTLSLPKVANVAVDGGAPDCGRNPGEDFAAAADDDFDQGTVGELRCTTRNSLPITSFFRPYSQELVGWFDDFSTTGTIDANGGIGRIGGVFNAFSFAASSGLPELLLPIEPTDLYGTGGGVPILDFGNTQRCPGSLERDPGDGSVPFTDGGELNCDSSQGPTGP